MREAAPGADVDEARRLEVFTLVWNAVEAGVSVAAGIVAGSTALVGFGADAGIESASGATLLWRLQHGEEGERREARALQLVGASFLLLAAWVAWDAGRTLFLREPPEASIPGMVIAALSLVVMPWLAWRKRRVARRMGSRALEADSRQTSLCAWLSGILLTGLVLHATLGWWWADPVAALIMVPIIAGEGREALAGERCDC